MMGRTRIGSVLCLLSRWIARLLEAIPHRMLGSHLTLNRTLATHILLVRLQPQPLPLLTVRSWLFDFDITHPFLLSSRTLCDDLGLQWSSTILLLGAFAKTRRRLTRGPRRRAWTRVYVGMVCFTLANRN